MTGFVPARLSIFKLAFSHKSNQATRDYARTNNERLEYLGDAVLGTIVAEYLFKKYPDADEGFLTKMRSKIVKRKSLNHIGDRMGLDVPLREYNRTRLSASMLGNAVEALVGAVYLEKGYRPTKRFVIQRMLKLYVDMHELETVDDNYKSQLLEYCQKNGKQISYKLIKKFKHDRRDRFKVAVMVGSREVAVADDFNKKAAEQLASLRALEQLGVVDKGTAKKKSKVEKSGFEKRQAAQKTSKPDADESKVTRKSRSKKSAVDSGQPDAAVLALDSTPNKDSRVKSNTQRPALSSSVKLPARKKRRNNTQLGRAVWHATATANAVLEFLDGPPADSVRATARSTAKAQQSASKLQPVRRAELVEGEVLEIVGTVVSITDSGANSSKRKLKHKAASSKSSTSATRKRRSVPLTRLKPMLADAAAAIELSIIAKERLPFAVVYRSKSQSAARTTQNWDDTPLVLGEEVIANEPPIPETLSPWEDQLLEINEATRDAPHQNSVKPREGRSKS